MRSDLIGLWISPLPHHLVRPHTNEGGYIEMEPPTPAEVAEWLSAYPTLSQLGEPTRVDHVNPADIGTSSDAYGVVAGWTVDEQLDWSERYQYCARFYDVPHGGRRIPDGGLVLPAVGGNRQPMRELCTWWALLYSFSMLARYHPREWRALLDVDSSAYAVPLATVLGRAVWRVPELISVELAAAYDVAPS